MILRKNSKSPPETTSKPSNFLINPYEFDQVFPLFLCIFQKKIIFRFLMNNLKNFLKNPHFSLKMKEKLFLLNLMKNRYFIFISFEFLSINKQPLYKDPHFIEVCRGFYELLLQINKSRFFSKEKSNKSFKKAAKHKKNPQKTKHFCQEKLKKKPQEKHQNIENFSIFRLINDSLTYFFFRKTHKSNKKITRES